MPVTIDQIKALMSVAHLKSFAAAAERLNATQPGISYRIKKLEEELGVELFTRTTRSVELTPEGRRSLVHAERTLNSLAQMEAEFKDPTRFSGVFRIGVSDCVAETWLSDLMAHIDAVYPNLRPEFHSGQIFSFIEKLETGEFDLAFSGGSRNVLAAKNISSSYLGSLQYEWMCRGQDADKYNTKIRPEDLQTERIVTYHRDTLLFNLIEAWFAYGDTKFERWSSFDTTTSIASQTMAGMGVGLLPKTIYADQISEGKLAILPSAHPLPPLHYYAMYVSSTATAAHHAIVKQAVNISNFPKLKDMV